jgi:hypothetical protein
MSQRNNFQAANYPPETTLCALLTYFRLVDVVISASIGTSDGHDDKVATLDQVIVDRRLQFVGMLLYPFAKVDGKGNHCVGVRMMLRWCGWWIKREKGIRGCNEERRDKEDRWQ